MPKVMWGLESPTAYNGGRRSLRLRRAAGRSFRRRTVPDPARDAEPRAEAAFTTLMERIHRIQSNGSDLALSQTHNSSSGPEEEWEEDLSEKKLEQLEKDRQVDERSMRPILQDTQRSQEPGSTVKGHHNILPRGRTAMHLAIATPLVPVTQVISLRIAKFHESESCGQ